MHQKLQSNVFVRPSGGGCDRAALLGTTFQRLAGHLES